MKIISIFPGFNLAFWFFFLLPHITGAQHTLVAYISTSSLVVLQLFPHIPEQPRSIETYSNLIHLLVCKGKLVVVAQFAFGLQMILVACSVHAVASMPLATLGTSW